MAYQNNNSRVTPEAKEDRTLKPAATPVNKLINYNPAFNQGNATMWNNTATALASIGKGMVDMDNLWRRQSEENAIKAAWETNAENRDQWKEVSKNIKGAAKFNPYNKDAYNRLKSMDIMRAGLMEFMTTPDLDKMDADKFYQLQQTKNQEILTAMKEAKLSPKDYGDALVQWNTSLKSIEENYVLKKAEHTFKQAQTKMASDMSFELASTMLENPDLDKSIACKSVIDNKIQQMSELGWAAETQVGVLFASAKGFLAKNADMITGAEFKAAVSEIVIDGKKASEIIPNFDAQVRDLYRQAQKDIYEDKSFAYQNHQLDLKIASQNAMKDMYDWSKQNPNASYTEVLAQTQSIVEKYGLEEEGFSFIKEMAGDKETLRTMMEVKSDPATLQSLGAQAALGELNGAEVNQAVLDGKLNWRDALSFSDRVNRDLKADLSAVKTQYTNFNTKLGKNGLYGKTLGADSKDLQELQLKANETINLLNRGEINVDEAQKRIQDTERIAEAKVKLKNFKATNDSFLLNANYIRTQTAPIYNRERAIAAFNQLGLERNTIGAKVKADVTSAPNDNRKINGKAAPHKGYDLGATPQTKIHNVNMRGTVIYAGYDKGFGNYAVIKYDNGSYMRVGHMATSTSHLQGKTILAGQYIGNAGNTGFSTGTHLHVDFWDKNRQLISVERFKAGIR